MLLLLVSIVRMDDSVSLRIKIYQWLCSQVFVDWLCADGNPLAATSLRLSRFHQEAVFTAAGLFSFDQTNISMEAAAASLVL